MSEVNRILILDDHELFRECLGSLLEQHGLGMIETAGSAGSYRRVKEFAASIVMVNSTLCEGPALELTRKIRRELPEVKIIVFGLEDSESSILQWVESGANGYVLKQASVEELLTVIRLVAMGETMCSPRVAYSIFSRVAELSRRGRRKALQSITLSLRELEILRLIARGLSNKEIAERLCISPHTVKNHIHNMLEKLRAKNRSEAVHCAVQNSWLRDKPFP